MLDDIEDDYNDAVTVAADAAAANGVDNGADGHENNAILSTAVLANDNPYPNAVDMNQSLNETKPHFQKIITRLATNVQSKKGKGKGKIQKMKQTPKRSATMYKCNKCDYTTAKKSRMTRHGAVHSAKRPFSCDDCNTNYKFRDSLKNHMAKHHDVVLL